MSKDLNNLDQITEGVANLDEAELVTLDSLMLSLVGGGEGQVAL